jgi:hypothetical protein
MRDCSSASRTLAFTGCHSLARKSSQAQAAPANAAPASGTPTRRRPWPVSASPAHQSGHQAIRAQAAPSASRLPRRAAAVRRASADFNAHTVTNHSKVPAMPTYMAPDCLASQSPGLVALSSAPSASTACTPTTTRKANMALQTSSATLARSLARAFSSSSGSKCVGEKALECRSAGRVLAGHTLTGRVSAAPRSVSEGSWGAWARPPDAVRARAGASANLGRPGVFLTGVRDMARR